MCEALEQVAAVSDQMVQYNLHREELLLLQATVLVNAGMYSHKLTTEIMRIFIYCSKVNHITSGSDISHVIKSLNH